LILFKFYIYVKHVEGNAFGVMLKCHFLCKELVGMGRVLKDRYKREFVEVVCPTCRRTQIIAVPEEPMPKCVKCRLERVIKEVLTEGKY
jgi:ribosomal protein S27E